MCVCVFVAVCVWLCATNGADCHCAAVPQLYADLLQQVVTLARREVEAGLVTSRTLRLQEVIVGVTPAATLVGEAVRYTPSSLADLFTVADRKAEANSRKQIPGAALTAPHAADAVVK